MVKAIGGPSQPQPLARPAKKTEDPEQKPPAPASPAPAKDNDRDSLTTSQGGVDSKVAFEAMQRIGKKARGSDIGNSPARTGDASKKDEKGEKKAGSGEDTKKDRKEKPKDGPMTRDEAIGVVTKNYDEFDEGAGIDGKDGLFSDKDLDSLSEGDDELAEAANVLIEEDIVGELGGKDGKISRMDWTQVQKPVEGIEIETKSLNKDQTKDLEKSLKLLESDSDGSKLLDKIRKDGYTIKYDGAFNEKEDSNANAYQLGSNKTIGITEKFFNKSFEEQTGILGHELVHAATDADGLSKTEEGYAEAIEARITARVNRDKLSESDERRSFESKYGSKGYSDLKDDNGIRDSLEDLGITFNWSPD